MEDDHACFTAQQGPGKKHRGRQATMAAMPIGKSSGSMPAPSVRDVDTQVLLAGARDKASGIPGPNRTEAHRVCQE